MESLKNWAEANKKFLFWFGILLLVSFTSFSLGYFISARFNHAPIIIEEQPTSQAN